MAEEVVLLATGTDRPGIVDELSQFLLEAGGNITDSRSVNLRGQFALMMLVHGEKDAIERIRAGLSAATKGDMKLDLRAAAQTDTTTFPFLFIATGKDQAGVLHRISHLLRALNVNIEHITTHVAPDSSFEVRLGLSVQRETPVTMLRDYLTYLCNELGISGHLREA